MTKSAIISILLMLVERVARALLNSDPMTAQCLGMACDKLKLAKDHAEVTVKENPPADIGGLLDDIVSVVGSVTGIFTIFNAFKNTGEISAEKTPENSELKPLE